MDISKRDAVTTSPSRVAPELSVGHRSGTRVKSSSWLNIATVILLFGIAILLVAIAFLPRTTNNNEVKFVNSKVFQAVSVSTGGNAGDQIYFGNIKELNGSYLVLNNVFYIPPSSSAASITLEPLVCQVDSPFNQMVINRASVNWWENLQSTGKVAKAITSYEKNNKTPSCPQAPSTSSTFEQFKLWN